MNKNITNKSGMTLVELMVYIALAAMLVVPIMILMKNSSVNMTRSAVNTDLRISGRDILGIMYDDIKNTGFKVENIGAPDWKSRLNCNVTYIAAGCATLSSDLDNLDCGTHDCSSFMPVDEDGVAFDELTIIKGVLNEDGSWSGIIDTIRYWVDNVMSNGTGSLMRKVGTSPSSPPQTIAHNVEALQFMYMADLSTVEDPEWLNGNYFDVSGLSAEAAKCVRCYKRDIKYIKIFLVLRDDKQVGVSQTVPAIDDWDPNYTVTSVNKPILRERFEIVVPIPNNGLFIPDMDANCGAVANACPYP